MKLVTVTTGSSCSHSSNTTGTVDATTDDDGSTNGTVRATTSGSTNCSNDTTRHYTISVSQQTFVIEPELTKGQKVLRSPQWGGAHDSPNKASSPTNSLAPIFSSAAMRKDFGSNWATENHGTA